MVGIGIVETTDWPGHAADVTARSSVTSELHLATGVRTRRREMLAVVESTAATAPAVGIAQFGTEVAVLGEFRSPRSG